MTLKERAREIDRLSNGNYHPLVHTEWGYAAFYAYVYRIKKPAPELDEWWLVEMNEESQVIEIKQLCLY